METFPGNSAYEIRRFVSDNGTKFFTGQARTGISYDSRNRTFFATRGAMHALTADIALPGGDLEYYNISYRAQQYVPLFWKFTAEINGSVGYVDSYGNDDVPPWETYFAGGPQTVRGYKDGRSEERRVGKEGVSTCK